MFERGPIRGASAAQEKCAARDGLCRDTDWAWVAQLVERVLGKDEVTGSIPVPGSRKSVGAAGAAAKKFGATPGGGNSTVESHSSKVMVAGSNPVPRSRF